MQREPQCPTRIKLGYVELSLMGGHSTLSRAGFATSLVHVLTRKLKQYTPIIDAILKNSDLSTISVKKVRNGLSEQTGVDFTPVKVHLRFLVELSMAVI